MLFSRMFVIGMVILLLMESIEAQGNERRLIITESTATVGRSGAFKSNDTFIAGVVGVADLGIRWLKPSGVGYGFSLLAGRDFPNEGSLAGLRGRINSMKGRGMIEGSVALAYSSAGNGYVSSFGLIFGIAYYPVQWCALVAQVDVMPTWRSITPSYQHELTHNPSFSYGLRLAKVPGVIPWFGTGVIALLWALGTG